MRRDAGVRHELTIDVYELLTPHTWGWAVSDRNGLVIARSTVSPPRELAPLMIELGLLFGVDVVHANTARQQRIDDVLRIALRFNHRAAEVPWAS